MTKTPAPTPASPPLAPGSTIGILGGGQLGRMTALAAARLGYGTHVFCPEPDAPALRVTDRATLSGYEDTAALEAFARTVDVVTLEFENIPVAALERLAALVPTHPGPSALSVCQDRLAEKGFARDLGIGTAPFAAVPDRAALDGALLDGAVLDGDGAGIGVPAILKANRLGYDGKGQTAVDGDTDLDAAWARIGGVPAILEGRVDFVRELSIIVARGADGRTACFPLAENHHENHVLSRSIAPAPASAHLQAAAEDIARRMAEGLGLVGLLAVELFETPSGDLLVNEMAPRPHNSGHWTQDGCAVDQFEQLVRAVCGLPLARPDVLAPTEMVNLLGDAVDGWPRLLAEPGARLHLYGKAEARPGRKMGHVNRPLARD